MRVRPCRVYTLCLFAASREYAVFLGYLHLDVAEVADHQQQVVLAAVGEVASFHAGKAALNHLYGVVEVQVLGGELDVAGFADAVDGVLQLHQIAVGNLGEAHAASPLLRPVGQKIVDVRALWCKAVGFGLGGACYKYHAGDDVLPDFAAGTVGVDLPFFLGGHEALAARQRLLDVFAAADGVLLV